MLGVEHWDPQGAIPFKSLKAILQNIRNDFSWPSPLSPLRQAPPWVSSWKSSSVTLSFARGVNIPP